MKNLSLDSRGPASRGHDGFTIIELLAVVMIMAILGAIVIGISGYASRRASDAQARAQLNQLRTALTEYQVRHRTYPLENIESVQGWEDITPALTNFVEEKLTFEDPWGRAYEYRPRRRPGETTGRAVSFELWSWGPSGGPDNVPSGEDYEYDIIR